MATLDDIRQWLDRDLRPRVVLLPGEPADSIFRLAFRTNRYAYEITADPASDYLGCTCRTRFNVPGKGHPEFADLPDGKITEETWKAIVAEIKRLEIQPYRGLAL